MCPNLSIFAHTNYLTYMYSKSFSPIVLALALLFSACATNKKAIQNSVVTTSTPTAVEKQYHITNISRSRILVDSRYDAMADTEAADFMKPYKNKVDSIMSPVVGKVSCDMTSHRPESPMTDLFSDILVWGSRTFNEKPAFAVYNAGGIRAAFAKGDITIGDVLDAAPFENKICFLTLSGADVIKLFGDIAARGGEGVSKSVELVITKHGKLKSARLGGKAINPKANYRVATLDYLAQGNDGLTTFKKGTNIVSPQNEKNNVRYIIMDYFRSQKGKPVGNPMTAKGAKPRIKVVAE